MEDATPKERERIWRKILNGKKNLSDKEADDIKEKISHLRKENRLRK